MRVSFFLLFALFAFAAKSQVTVADPDKIVNLAYNAQYIEDPAGHLKIQTIIDQNSGLKFKQVDKHIIGVRTNAIFFLDKILYS